MGGVKRITFEAFSAQELEHMQDVAHQEKVRVERARLAELQKEYTLQQKKKQAIYSLDWPKIEANPDSFCVPEQAYALSRDWQEHKVCVDRKR
jgi:hypothetical protein